ncbi:MAG: DUF3786 domain-containing protein [Candidatus Omnitrophica bacterium]|nr:DUF3786 domain-containing protein [Candidatus Omnitrophota bacterium]
MGYEVAVSKAWAGLEGVAQEKNYSIKFLGDEYAVDLPKRSIFSTSCNVPAKTQFVVLILHYLTQKIKGLPRVKGEWISFKELDGGQAYYSVFKKRVLERIAKKYEKIQSDDSEKVLDVFEGVPILVRFWKGDDEFGPEANVLFDKSIPDIFCTEDIVVLAECIAGLL